MFNEKVLYKDRLGTSETSGSNPDVVELDISNSGGSRLVQDRQEPIEEESHSDDD